jgi:molybdate transport system ATP-binding protein
VAEPDILLLDEPFSALDYDTRGRIYDELLTAHELWRIPFILVTHERSEAERLGDRILYLRGGRQVDS